MLLAVEDWSHFFGLHNMSAYRSPTFHKIHPRFDNKLLEKALQDGDVLVVRANRGSEVLKILNKLNDSHISWRMYLFAGTLGAVTMLIAVPHILHFLGMLWTQQKMMKNYLLFLRLYCRWNYRGVLCGKVDGEIWS